MYDMYGHLHLGIFMVSRHHLGEVNQYRPVLIVHHEVELIEVAMNDSMVGQLYNQVHQITVELRDISDFMHIAPEDD